MLVHVHCTNMYVLMYMHKYGYTCILIVYSMYMYVFSVCLSLLCTLNCTLLLNTHIQNIDLQVQLENLKKELADKDQLLLQAKLVCS